MGLAHFLTFRGPAEASGELVAWFRDARVPDLADLACVDYVDLYTPSSGDHTDPFVDDRDGPILMVQTGHADLLDVQKFLVSPAFAAASVLGAAGISGLCLTHDVMTQEFFAVGDDEAPRPMEAPLSFVVRYHEPCEDSAVFTGHYRQGHATALAQLPAIRNVLVYARTEWDDPSSVERAEYLLGNEVVFDSLDHLNAALNSPLRHELREHYKSFPGWSGHNTHYAMDRVRIVA